MDSQITASSQYRDHHSYGARLARLHFQKTGQAKGGWAADVGDIYPWLQIDLGSQYVRVIRLATQGRNGYTPSQFVTRYKLQYSNDGETFGCYTEQGQTTEKVKLYRSQNVHCL